MKRFLTLTALLLLCGTVARAQQKPERELPIPNGPVRSELIQTATPMWNSGKWQEAKFLPTFYCLYNQQGKRVEWHTYENGKLIRRTVEMYDSAGRNTRTVEYTDDNNIINEVKRKFNERGDVVERLTSKNTPGSREFIYYDSAGRPVKEVIWYILRDAESRWETHYTYNEQGNLTEQTNYNDKGEVDSKKLTSTDTIITVNNGEMRIRHTIIMFYDNSGSPGTKEVRLYDSNSTLRAYQAFDAISNRPDAINEYNAQGLLSYILTRGYGSSWETMNIIYDNHDNAIAQHYAYYADYPSPGTAAIRYDTLHSTVDYDTYGNWIQRTWTKGAERTGESVDQPYMIETREITYFKE